MSVRAGKYPIAPGMRVGQLLILKQVPRPEGKPAKSTWWLCRCSCGRDRTITRTAIREAATAVGCCCRRTKEEAFWERVDKNGPVPPHMPHLGPCWSWTGTFDGRYGMFLIAPLKRTRAHRVALALSGVHVPREMVVCHRCDNGRCVNPSHLFVGTNADNSADAKRKGRIPSGQRWAATPRRRQLGEASPVAKLTNEIVLRIRALADGGMSHVRISKEVGVSRAHVWAIARRKSWTTCPSRKEPHEPQHSHVLLCPFRGR